MSKRLIYSFIIGATLIAGALVYAVNTPAVKTADSASSIRTPKSDDRQYDRFTLDNGMDVLVVSDPTTEKAAASLRVGSGSWQDPEQRPGLAHFLEHMLFLGTDLYPEPDEFGEFIQSNGGSHNAMTASQATIYFFDINSASLESALSRFSRFFVAPLMNEDYVERERHAVNAEFQSNLQQDGRRIMDVMREILNPEHPSAKFSTGNLQTLNTEGLKSDLEQFYQRYYRAGNMQLVIYGSQPIAELRKIAAELFEPVPEGNAEQVEYPDLYESGRLPAFLEVRSVKDLKELSFSFPVPGTDQMPETRPGYLIAQVLNKEHPGSLSRKLKDAGLINGMYAGTQSRSEAETMFEISLQLTEAGEESIADIGRWVFGALEQLRNQGIKQWQFDEINQLQEIRFDYQEAYSPSGYVLQLTSQMARYDSKNTLYGPYRVLRYSPDDIQGYLNLLNADSALVTRIAPDIRSETTSLWYNTSYKLTKIPEEWAEVWRTTDNNNQLVLAIPNPFIPDSLEIYPNNQPESALYPNLPDTRIDDQGFRFWFLQHNEFNSPKVDTRVSVRSDWFRENAENRAATELYLRLVRDSLDEISRDASAAGLGYNLWQDSQGLALRLYGFDDKLNLLTDAVLNELVSYQPDPERTARMREQLVRNYENQSKDRLSSQIVRQLNEYIVAPYYNSETMAAAMAAINLDKLIEVRSRLQQPVQLEILTLGNMLPAQADLHARRLAGNFVIGSEDNRGQSEILLLDRQTAHKELVSGESDSAIFMYYQSQTDSFREKALFGLLKQVSQAQFFNELRTEKQLGYIVQVLSIPFHQLPGLGYLIQSPDTDPGLLRLHIEKFQRDDLQRIQSLSDEEFEQYKTSLMAKLTEPDQNLVSLGSRYWENIRYDVPHFNQNQRVAEEIRKISQDGFLRFYQNQIVTPDAKRIIVYHVGSDHREDFVANYRLNTGERVLPEPETFADQRNRLTY